MPQAFPTCINLMVQVHDLIDVGLGDSTEVDAIQDEMDGLWKNLSEGRCDGFDIIQQAYILWPGLDRRTGHDPQEVQRASRTTYEQAGQ